MADNEDKTLLGLAQYRPYLKLLARRSMRALHRGKFDSSDLVQDTLLKAHQRLTQFRGATQRELRAWLGKILRNNLLNAIEAAGAGKRNLAVETLLDEGLAETPMRLETWLGASPLSPSDEAVREQRVLRLAEILEELPDDQRMAVELRYLQGCSVEEIGQAMNRSHASVAGLLRRGLAALRQVAEELGE
jgi:RNA polymerase sigma-70 factor, ECF subfamily